MLEMRNVSYSYTGKGKAEIPVLKDMSMSFEKGKTYALFGPSGSGKTTTLMLLGGLEKPTRGAILLDGTDIIDIGYRKLRQKSVSYVFQDFLLFPYMTAVENVMVASEISDKYHKKEQRKRSEELLRQLGLTESEMNRVVTKLSGGQQQRVAIARALVTDSDYILADEPTGNLDAENTASIVKILCDIAHQNGKAVIIVTHSEFVRQQCDESYCIEKR